MQEANQALTTEYVKRVCLDSLDRQNFLNFVKPYRNGNVVDFEKMRQTGVLEEYNLLAYLTIASALGKQILEEYMKEHAGYGKDPQEMAKIEAQINRLKGLQAKTSIGQDTGGFFDTLEISIEDGMEKKKSSLEIGENHIDVSGKSIEQQVEFYRMGVHQMILSGMNSTIGMGPEEAMTEICNTVMRKEPVIKEVVEERSKENIQEKQMENYQKIMTQN